LDSFTLEVAATCSPESSTAANKHGKTGCFEYDNQMELTEPFVIHVSGKMTGVIVVKFVNERTYTIIVWSF
jgi:hypothetical protein